MRIDFLSKLVCSPWDIDPLRGRNIIGAIASRLLNRPNSERPAEDVFGDALPKMQLVGNVALIPITGVIAMNVPDWLKEYGFNLTDANDIEEEIEEALEDENVELIMFDVDSPGGMSLAGNKLFDLVEAANRKKPCFAFCGDGCDMASAAYDAVAPCVALYAGYFADVVGCIGSYLAYMDDTQFWAQMGITIEVFRSGELKGIGEDSLTEPQRAYLQSLVDQAGATFRTNVKKYRTAVAEEDMQGQWFDGKSAARRGFVAANVDDMQGAIARSRRMIAQAA
jgi:ClpP class serine protease